MYADTRILLRRDVVLDLSGLVGQLGPEEEQCAASGEVWWDTCKELLLGFESAHHMHEQAREVGFE